METPSALSSGHSQPTDIIGLRLSGIFPKDKEPSIRTLRDWTKPWRIPHHRIGHFVYYDLAEVSNHIRTELKVPARRELAGNHKLGVAHNRVNATGCGLDQFRRSDPG